MHMDGIYPLNLLKIFVYVLCFVLFWFSAYLAYNDCQYLRIKLKTERRADDSQRRIACPILNVN